MSYQHKLELGLRGGYRDEELHLARDHPWAGVDHQVTLLVLQQGHLCPHNVRVVDKYGKDGMDKGVSVTKRSQFKFDIQKIAEVSLNFLVERGCQA